MIPRRLLSTATISLGLALLLFLAPLPTQAQSTNPDPTAQPETAAQAGPAGETAQAAPPAAPRLAPPVYYLPSAPEEMTLCGEKVPLDQPAVAEMLDREFTIMVHDRAQVVMWLKRAWRYFPYITQRLREEGLPDDLKYVAVAESALIYKVASPAGAVGIWQFIPATARRYGLRVNHSFDDRQNPMKATDAAIAYLKDLHQKFGSWPLAMAAYNCGERRVDRELAEQGVSQYWDLWLPDETMRYVFRILAAKVILAEPERYGYRLPQACLYAPQEVDSVELKLRHSLHLRTLAAQAGTTLRRLKELNPELRTYHLPRGEHTLAVPKGSGAALEAKLAAILGNRTTRVRGTIPSPAATSKKLNDDGSCKVVTVRKGDTLSGIAKDHGVSVDELRQANRMRGSALRAGQELLVPQN